VVRKPRKIYDMFTGYHAKPGLVTQVRLATAGS
jgi:hypothetical protein